MKELFRDTVEYQSFLGDGELWDADYAAYTLDGVLLREKWAVDPEDKNGGEIVLYYFPGHSVCTDANGVEVLFPNPHFGDRVLLRQGTDENSVERIFRVTEASLYNGHTLAVRHIRLRLKACA